MAQDPVDRSLGEQAAPSGPSEGAQTASKTGGAMTAASGPPDDPGRRTNPGSPSDVPIDDHVHWLLAAGLLWGVWRLSRG
jgi:hypothetical protein